MMNHTIFLGSVEVVKLEHFTCLEHRTVKEKGRYYKLKGQKHYNFMVLPRLGSLVRSNQSIDQKKKKSFLLEALTMQVLPNVLITPLPVFLLYQNDAVKFSIRSTIKA